MKERQRFEKWAKNYGLLLFRSENEYKMFDTQRAWYAWQAAQKDTCNGNANILEAHAEVCRKMGNGLIGEILDSQACKIRKQKSGVKIAPIVQKICELLEMADQRAMTVDGPIDNDGAFNQLDLKEKRIFYKCCDAIRKLEGEI